MPTDSKRSASRFTASVLIPLVVCLLGLAPLQGRSQSKWSGSVEASVASAFLYRGYRYGGASIQPGITAVYDNKLTLGIWGTYAFEKIKPFVGSNIEDKYNETDYFANYAISKDKYTILVGGTVYNSDNLLDGADDYQPNDEPFDYYFEAYFAFQLKNRLNPMLSIWRETGRFNTNYVELSLNPSFTVNARTSASLRGYVGFAQESKQFFKERNEYYGVDFSMTYDLGNQMYVRGNITAARTTFRDIESENRLAVSATLGHRW